MKPTNPTKVQTDLANETLVSQLSRKPSAPPAPTDSQGKTPVKTNGIVDAETGSEVGVEDEVAYVVAEGTPNADLAGASGLFGGAAAGLLGPAGLAAAGLAGLGLLAGSGGDGGGDGGGATPPAPTPPAPTPPAPPPVPPIDPPPPPIPPSGDAESTGVAGALIAAADGIEQAGGPTELADGLRQVAGGLDTGADSAEAIPAAGTSVNQIVGQVESDGSPSGIVGGLGSLANNDPSGTFSAGVVQSGADALPIQPEMAAAIDPVLGEILSDIVGNTGAASGSASNAGSPDDLLSGGIASTISSAADSLGAGSLPTPPAV